MQTLFDVGDEIEVTVRGKVKNISVSEQGDCYVVSIDMNLMNEQQKQSCECHLYFDSQSLTALGAKLARSESPQQ